MIVAIEGASAAGKTTWCRSQFPENCVLEPRENIAAPDLFADPAQVAQFWVKHAIENWQKVLRIERDHGIAACDGDPFHLYYSWALWKSGALAGTLFEIESTLYRRAFEHHQIGFVDRVLWIDLPVEELRRRAKADVTRRRKRHELYLSLIPWMKSWFQARESFLPGSIRPVENDLRSETLNPLPRSQRYDVQLMTKMVEQLSQ